MRSLRPLFSLCLFLPVLSTAPGAFGDGRELIKAAREGDVQRVRELMGAGADLNAKDEDGLTVLWLAASEDRPDMLEMFLQAGADPDGEGSQSPLVVAAERGSLDCVRLLLDAGANMHAQASVGISGVGSGTTEVIGVAAFHNHPEIVRFLADRGAVTGRLRDSDVRVRNRPTTEGSRVIGMLQRGDVVTVLGRSESDVQIGDAWDYWLRIRLKDGTVGYSFGAFFETAPLAKSGLPPFFALSGSHWGPPRPSFGFVLEVGFDRTYRLHYAGEGGGQQSRGTWKLADETLVLDRKDASGEEYLPEWARKADSSWTVAEDPENIFYQYRLTNPDGDSFWSLTFPVQPGTRRRFQERTVLAEGGRLSRTLGDAAVRERPSIGISAGKLEFWSSEEGFYTQDFLPKDYPVQLLARTETVESVQGRSDSWYYVRILVKDDAYGRDYLGWVHGAQLRK